MKKIFMLLMLLFVFSASKAQRTSVKVSITGIQDNKGVVMVGLFNNATDFPTIGKQIKTIELKISNKSVSACFFTDLPDGSYAIAIWHDKNQNGQLDKNFFGIPKEKYGFSNNAFGTFGAPSFSQASFKVVNGKVLNLNINLK